jgi:hypothetical protein
MELSNLERRILLTCLRYLYKAGPHFVSMLWEGDSPPKQQDWEDLKKHMKRLYKKIKEGIDDGNIPEPKVCRDHFIKQRQL